VGLSTSGENFQSPWITHKSWLIFNQKAPTVLRLPSEYLTQFKAFYSLSPYLSESAVTTLQSHHYATAIKSLINEIARIEKEWGLF
jgi:hypothetical protein